MKRIKNIVFDFGGVILNIHHNRVEDAFREIGVNDFDKLFNQAVQSELFMDFEKGYITPFQFRREIRKLTGLPLTDPEIDKAWNKIIGNYPVHRIKLLQSLKQNYRLFILSNTNEIHYNDYIPKFYNKFNLEFESLFEKTYWSFQIGKRKPDSDIYKFIIDDSMLIPEDTLFIDDSIQNIEPANQMSIVGFHLKQGVDIDTLFNFGLLV